MSQFCNVCYRPDNLCTKKQSFIKQDSTQEEAQQMCHSRHIHSKHESTDRTCTINPHCNDLYAHLFPEDDFWPCETCGKNCRKSVFCRSLICNKCARTRPTYRNDPDVWKDEEPAQA